MNKRLSVLSLICFVTLLCPASALGIGTGLLLFFALFWGAVPMLSKMPRKRTIVLSGAALIALASAFYHRWHPSSIVGRLAGMLHMETEILLLIVSAFVMMGAVPFVCGALDVLVSRDADTLQALSGRMRFLDSNTFLYISSLLYLCGIAVSFYYACSKSMWIDEAFTLRITSYSYGDIIAMCAMDVHVPLYYFIIKTIVDGLHWLCPGVPVIYFAKASSIVPYLLMGVIALTAVRKEWGNYVAGLMAVCICAMPQMMEHSIDIRMYSWAMLFLLLALLATHHILKAGKRRSWILLVCVSLAAAYTHHYALISVAAVWFFLFVWHIADRKSRFGTWLLWAVLTVMGYLPWLINLMGQLRYVSNSYWIQPITLRTIVGYLEYVFQNGWLFAAWILMLAHAAYLLATRKSAEAGTAVCGMLIGAFVACVGITVSFLFKPIFVARYLLPGFVCLWLGVLIGCRAAKNDMLRYCLALLIVFSGVMNMSAFCRSEAADKENAQQLHDLLEPYRGYTVVSTDDFVNREIAVITDNDCYLWSGDAEILMETVFGNIYDLNEDADQIRTWISQGEKIIFVTLRAEESIAAHMQQTYGFSLEHAGSGTAGAKGIVQEIEIYELTVPDPASGA